ncbi:spatacsin isoform X2 [Syngnathoides biaculeatus]|uniref:spatacsin isoform X2 n=1 Tax=Syngnathoides biaculeatus TaxID=300417 RepID=UPI002ADDEAE8|nr:spatacsin isoform X2 [Syngnathoides biaculeatus]
MAETSLASALEVVLLPGKRHWREVADVVKAQLAPGGTWLGCLELDGTLVLWDPAEEEAAPVLLDGLYQDFTWEESVIARAGGGGTKRLLAVGSNCQLMMLEVDARSGTSLSVRPAGECPVQRLLQDEGVCAPRAARVLSFASGQCQVLLDGERLLRLEWSPGQEAARTLSCCDLSPADGGAAAAVHCCVRQHFAFSLSESGLVSIYDVTDGVLLAFVDVPAYLCGGPAEEREAGASWSRLRLLEVSADVSTAVVVARDNAVAAIDLDHYFRKNPEHLLCQATPARPPLRPQRPTDEDNLTSANCSLAALGRDFNADRSWGSRLTSMFNAAQKSSSWSALRPVTTSWSSSLPGHESLPAAPLSRPRIPPGGAAVALAVPESSVPSLLSVCDFSAMLVLAPLANTQTTAVLWDLGSGNVSYHRAGAERAAAVVELCGQKHHAVLLKKTGMFQVLFSVSQQDLLSSLMMFGSAATVDALCHLNNWGRCSIPIHSLKAGVKNRQLDTVDFYLKSKEDLLKAPSNTSFTERIKTVCPALDLLCAAIRESSNDAQSRQFSEQLLNVTLSFVNAQIRYMLTHMSYEDDDVRRCVDILNEYLTELRTFMRKYPWPAQGAKDDKEQASAEEDEKDEWDGLCTEEVVRLSVLTNQIPRAQAVFRRRGLPEGRLPALRATGLRLVYSCLQGRDLPTAVTLLTNMGFNVKKELHRICIYTHDRDLRDFVGDELRRRRYFSEEELSSVAFIKEAINLASLPHRRQADAASGRRPLQLVLHEEAAGGADVLDELLGRNTSEQEEAGLWQEVRLDWVMNWERSSRAAILLSRQQHYELGWCDGAVLWCHMTSFHNRAALVSWTESGEASGAARWPKLTAEVVNSSTLSSRFLREEILDTLARRAVFIPDELSDLDQLLWRLAQGGGLMTSTPPPVPRHLALDFHSRVIGWCLERQLQYLLYTYLEHYRLTPRNCPALSSGGPTHLQPWSEMIVNMQEITTNLTEPALVYQASLTCAQVVLPGSPPSLSSLLLEGHSLLALATIMFAPGGIDRAVVQGENRSLAECSVDPQLMKMALTAYPKLKAALFPAGPRGPGPFADVSVYHLLQGLHPLDPCRLFGWQAANSLNSSETTELPHFSSPHLVDAFALVERLDFLYYLRHGRPAVAFATFVLQQLIGCRRVGHTLQQARRRVHVLAVQSFNSPSAVSAAVCFCELLGLSSHQIRVDVKVIKAVWTHWKVKRAHCGHTHTLHTLVSKGVELVEAEPGAAEELIGYLEAAVIDSLEVKDVNRCSWEAAQDWSLPVEFCRLHGLPLSGVYPAHCARDGHFLNFLLFVQLHHFTAQQVGSLVSQFSPTLQDHLHVAFGELPFYSSGAPASPRGLFQLLLRSQEEAEPSSYLLQEALTHRSPSLAVLAACVQEAALVPCLCVWLLTVIDNVSARELTARLSAPAEPHQWGLHHLSIIWRSLLGRGLPGAQTLLRGFRLFMRDCPLLDVLSMFLLCCDHKNFTKAKVKLQNFHTNITSLSISGEAPPGGLLLQWLCSEAWFLLLHLCHCARSHFELRRLLQVLADVDMMNKDNGPDFRKLSRLSDLLQGSGVAVSPRLLQCNSASIQQEELQATVDALQARGFYARAQSVATVAQLPVQRLLMCQLAQELALQRSKRQWSRPESRVCFWRKCHRQLEVERVDPDSASRFFLSQADRALSESSTASDFQSELLAVREGCLLLAAAARWLSLRRPVPVERIQDLEKRLWVGRVRQHTLVAAIRTDSVFNLLPPDVNAYDLFMKDFSFCDIPELRTDTLLSPEGLPGPAEEHVDVDPLLQPAEKKTLALLLDEALDAGSVHEVSRACRYFSLYHPDLWLLLRCRALASGELGPQTLQTPLTPDDPEVPPRRLLHASPSVSSLSSFVLLPPLPEDDVAVHLQKMAEQCRHGNNDCKQVLSLYQLSKELQCSFSELSNEDPGRVLEKLLLRDHPEGFRNAQMFIRAQSFSADAVAEMVAAALVRAKQEQHARQTERQAFRPAEARDSLVQLITLCEDPNLVGLKVLEKLKSVPLRDLGCIVELLIAAHDCFSVTCNMEGIVRVLQAARHLSHAYLAPGEHYGLLVRMLTGIGRYNEMTYVFDLLHQNHRFEMLLRKKTDMDRGQSSGLKTALLDYIKRCLPADSEKHNMVALCFSMRREIGENHEMAARTQLKIIQSQAWVSSPELKSSLLKVLSLLKDAAESFTKDSCVHQASRCVRLAKLVTLQLHFLNHGSALRLVNLQPADMMDAAAALPRCYQVLVLSEAYGYSPDWAELVYQKTVLNADFAYLDELRRLRPLTSSLFEDIFKKLDGAPCGASANVRRLLTYCDDIYLRYRLAYQRQLDDVTQALLQDAAASSYLNDAIGAH